MTSFRRAILVSLALLAFGLPAQAVAADSKLDAYQVNFSESGSELETLAREGFDVTEARGSKSIEIVATPGQAKNLRSLGVGARLKRRGGVTARERAARMQRADGSWDVYRPYFDDTYVGTENADGTGAKRQTLYEELQQLASENQAIVKSVEIGRSVDNKPILALKVTKDAREVPDGRRPAVLYSSTQHAREWLAPETDRRLLRLYVENYGGTGQAEDEDGDPLPGVTKEELTQIVNQNELWFVVVANPDGYDFTFTPGNRLWRKNLREQNGQPGIQSGDGVDPNRNFATKWNYDDEGSSGDPAGETYRGTGPASEPETKALDGLLKRIDFEFQVNYHTAAELLLYPYGFQVETYTADDPIYRALSGTDADSAIKGNGPGAPHNYDPDVGAELYTTNGETTDHAHGRYGTLAWTPELDKSDSTRGGGESVFEFQDREDDVEDAFEKNIQFALDVAKSAKDPANPVNHLGNEAADFEVATFQTSYGDPQPVEVDAKRELGQVTMHYRVNNGAEQTAETKEWKGGERYGEGYDAYYHRLRGVVKDTKPGDSVEVWFEGASKRSQSFSYDAAAESDNPVLILAAEDYTGRSPDYADKSKPAYLKYYEAALQGAGVGYDVYDIDARGRKAPDRLGVLSHYKAVVWYTGDNQRTIEPDQPPTGAGAAKLADDEFRAVRDYLNEGGKLLYTGKKAGFSLTNQYIFNPQGNPPYCNAGGGAPPGACIPLSNDFLQYYLGAFQNNIYRQTKEAMSAVQVAFKAPLEPLTVNLNGGDSADNQDFAYSLTPTSSILPVEEYPRFKSQGVADYSQPGPLAPATGNYYVYSGQGNDVYKRLSRTVDLTGKTSGALKFKFSYDAEPDYDYVFVEAHTPGQDDWTTLPDVNGNTSQDTGASCTDGWQADGGSHPFLRHYQTRVGPTECTPTGSTGTPPGEWNAATGNSQGYQDWEVDLSRYAGQQVEVSITYATDPGVQNTGAFVDDTEVLANGASVAKTSFEEDLGGWSAGGPPPGSKPLADNWTRSTALFEEAAGVGTEDTLYYGFGLEGIRGADARTAAMKSSLQYLGVVNNGGNVPGGGNSNGNGAAGSGGVAGAIAFGKDRALRLSRRTLRVDSKRRTKIKLNCGPTVGSSCKGIVQILRSGKTLYGRRAFTTAANKDRYVTVRLTRSAYRRLLKAKRLRVGLVLLSRGSDGELRRASVRATMVPTRSRRR